MSPEVHEPAAARLCFVVPALDGPVSGGTLYNRELCAALAERGCQVTVCSPNDSRLDLLLAAAQHAFVDTLYLDHLPELSRRARRSPFLLTHYLPALVRAGRPISRLELSRQEARALEVAGGFLVTSDFMREAIEPLVAPKQGIFVVPPGSRASLSRPRPRAIGAPLRALVIANVLPGKRIAPLLEALSRALHEQDRLELSIVGRLDADCEYAARCAGLVMALPGLSARVQFRGALSHEQVLSALTDADLLLSASAMESYGMALADARVSGVPIVTCAGGYSAAHVDGLSGGQVVASTAELAAACLALVRDPIALAERRERARRHAPLARPWALVVEELLAQWEAAERRE